MAPTADSTTSPKPRHHAAPDVDQVRAPYDTKTTHSVYAMVARALLCQPRRPLIEITITNWARLFRLAAKEIYQVGEKPPSCRELEPVTSRALSSHGVKR